MKTKLLKRIRKRIYISRENGKHIAVLPATLLTNEWRARGMDSIADCADSVRALTITGANEKFSHKKIDFKTFQKTL